MANLDAMGIKLHFCWGGRVFLTGGAVSDAPVCCCVGEVWMWQIILLKCAGSVLSLCPAPVEPDLVGWAGKTNPLQQEVLPELRISGGKTWPLWECRREVSREFLFACLWGLASLLSPTAGKAWSKHPLWSCSAVCVHVMVVGAERWQLLCAGSPPEGQCVCGSGLAHFNTKWKKWVYSCLIKQETNVAPVQRGWITYFMNQISITMPCFVQEVICIYGPIFQQDKYDIRQDFPEVNSVNNKRLCQGKLRNDLTLTHLYCNAKMPLTKL